MSYNFLSNEKIEVSFREKAKEKSRTRILGGVSIKLESPRTLKAIYDLGYDPSQFKKMFEEKKKRKITIFYFLFLNFFFFIVKK